MQIKILDQTWKLDNTPSAVNDIFDKLNEKLESTDYHLSHMIVDGVEIYDDFEGYLLEKVTEVRLVEIIVKNFQEFADETVLSIRDYLGHAHSEVEVLANEFYQGVTNDTWKKFDQLLEGIDWILQALASLNNDKISFQEKATFSAIARQLQENVSVLAAALQDNDTTLVGDIINYEILPQLKMLNETAQKTIENEVASHDLT